MPLKFQPIVDGNSKQALWRTDAAGNEDPYRVNEKKAEKGIGFLHGIGRQEGQVGKILAPDDRSQNGIGHEGIPKDIPSAHPLGDALQQFAGDAEPVQRVDVISARLLRQPLRLIRVYPDEVVNSRVVHTWLELNSVSEVETGEGLTRVLDMYAKAKEESVEHANQAWRLGGRPPQVDHGLAGPEHGPSMVIM
jgi:hypothetical protein